MDMSEIEENVSAIGEPKLHGGMCKTLSVFYSKLVGIFPLLEAARPRSTSGIQALCSLHIALEKTKNILQHCSECSKLYLAITGDSVVLKFDKARCALEDSLRRVKDIVPDSIGCRVSDISSELEGIVFLLDPTEKQIGVDIIGLLQQGRSFQSNGNENDNYELESFHQAATRLGITSSRAALTERRALKKLIERARVEEDKRKESIVAYLLHLMKKYSKLFRNEFSDDNDSQGSTPCSPTTFQGSSGDGGEAFERQLSKLSSFNFKPSLRKSEQMPLPPEELRCPISLQLMYDPAIIASGQTYERICIEKWFGDGHSTCPKTQQQLPHLCLTPNYCVKGLINSWCEQNGIPVPDAPPESLDFNYWRLVLSESDSASTKSLEMVNPSSCKSIKVVPLEESCILEETEGAEAEVEADDDLPDQEEDYENNLLKKYKDFLLILRGHGDLRKKCRVVEQIRRLLKDDEEARIHMGDNGFVEALMGFLESAMLQNNRIAQEVATMALFNLAVNNNRNKEMMMMVGVIPLLEEMMEKAISHSPATALCLNLSCLEEAKPTIGSSKAVPFLVGILINESDHQCKLDALHALFNLSTLPSNIPNLLSAGIIQGLLSLVNYSVGHDWTEKCVAILVNLASSRLARDEMIHSAGLISGLATVLDVGEPVEQEQAAACLLILCNGNERCSQMVLQEGVIPSLVSISMSGTIRGKQKAQKLLMLFREQRQQDTSPVLGLLNTGEEEADESNNPEQLNNSVSKRKLGRAWSYWFKSKSFSVYHC